MSMTSESIANLAQLGGNEQAMDGVRFLLHEARRSGFSSVSFAGVNIASSAPPAGNGDGVVGDGDRNGSEVDGGCGGGGGVGAGVDGAGVGGAVDGAVESSDGEHGEGEGGETIPLAKLKAARNQRPPDRYNASITSTEYTRRMRAGLPIASESSDQKRQKQFNQAQLAEPTEPAACAEPVTGSIVDVFSVHEGWRRGRITEADKWGTTVRFEDSDEAVKVQLSGDFKCGHVRHARPQVTSYQAEWEGKKVLVPASFFGQMGDERYAGVVQTATCRSVSIFFPIDAKVARFPMDQVRECIVDDATKKGVWERLVPRLVPDGWPGEVLFCSFPLQEGVHTTALLKKLCMLSELMPGVSIRPVPPDHPCYGTGFARGLFATKTFQPYHTIGTYAGVIGDAEGTGTQKAQRPQEGQFAIDLDIAQSMGSAIKIEIDAKYVGNETRFINDYRGIALRPNVEFCTKACARKGLWVDVKAAVDIYDGDEILVDYGDEFMRFAVDRSD